MPPSVTASSWWKRPSPSVVTNPRPFAGFGAERTRASRFHGAGAPLSVSRPSKATTVPTATASALAASSMRGGGTTMTAARERTSGSASSSARPGQRVAFQSRWPQMRSISCSVPSASVRVTVPSMGQPCRESFQAMVRASAFRPSLSGRALLQVPIIAMPAVVRFAPKACAPTSG